MYNACVYVCDILLFRFICIIVNKSYDAINTHIYRLSSVAFLVFFKNSNCILQIIKKAAMLSVTR